MRVCKRASVNLISLIREKIITCTCTLKKQGGCEFSKMTQLHFRCRSLVICGMGAWHRLRSGNSSEPWSGNRQGNPAEPSACRHFTQMRESLSVQFSPGDSWESFSSSCLLKAGTQTPLRRGESSPFHYSTFPRQVHQWLRWDITSSGLVVHFSSPYTLNNMKSPYAVKWNLLCTQCSETLRELSAVMDGCLTVGK